MSCLSSPFFYSDFLPSPSSHRGPSPGGVARSHIPAPRGAVSFTSISISSSPPELLTSIFLSCLACCGVARVMDWKLELSNISSMGRLQSRTVLLLKYVFRRWFKNKDGDWVEEQMMWHICYSEVQYCTHMLSSSLSLLTLYKANVHHCFFQLHQRKLLVCSPVAFSLYHYLTILSFFPSCSVKQDQQHNQQNPNTASHILNYNLLKKTCILSHTRKKHVVANTINACLQKHIVIMLKAAHLSILLVYMSITFKTTSWDHTL